MFAGNLEYLMSSLPNLTFQNSNELRSSTVLLFKNYASSAETSNNIIAVLDDEAKKFVSAKQFRLFKKIELKNIHSETFKNSSNKALSAFSSFTFLLKQELKNYRIAKRSNDNSTKINYEFLGELSNKPLEAEEQLIKLQWNELEALSIGNYANFSALIIYKLKIQLLLRWWSFDSNKGFELFTKTINQD